MDALNSKILLCLMRNSRESLTSLSKKVRSSREVVSYRINKLKKDRIIIDFVTEIDIVSLGFVASAVFVNIKLHRHKEFKEYLKSKDFISWAGAHCGRYSFGFSIYGKNSEDIDEKFLELHKKFKGDITDYWTRIHKETTFFYEKFFGKYEHQKIKRVTKNIDDIDRHILGLLSNNSRTDTVRIANQVKLSAPAIAQRIKNLENTGVIKKYSLFVDLSKLGLIQYSAFIVNKNIEERPALLACLKEHKNISFVAEYIAEPIIECGIIVSNPYKLRQHLLEIENNFQDTKIQELFLLQEEFFSIGTPPYVFK